MSMEYIERRVQEALELHLGNTHKARQQVIAWTYEDENLLHALAKPHLSGIVAYHIERVASGRAEAAKKGPPPAPKPSPEQHKPAKTKANVDADEFGLNILKAVTSIEAGHTIHIDQFISALLIIFQGILIWQTYHPKPFQIDTLD